MTMGESVLRTPVLAQPVGVVRKEVSEGTDKVGMTEKDNKLQPDKEVSIKDKVFSLVALVSGVEVNDVELYSAMANMGIDSLMMMELAREVEVVFGCKLGKDEYMEATTLRKFVACVENAVKGL
jgi:acyl carrier protein